MKKLLLAIVIGTFVFGCSKEPDVDKKGTVSVLLELSENSIHLDAAGGKVGIGVNCSHEWYAGLPENIDWLSFSPVGVQDGNGELLIEATPNSTGSIRSATIEIRARSEVKQIRISQDIFTLSVSPSSLDFGFEGGTGYVTVTTSAPYWSFQVTSTTGDTGWLDVAKDGSDRIAVTAVTNSGARRDATLQITAGELLIKKIALSQAKYWDSGYWDDGEVFGLQSATKGEGVEIILMGDGYTYSDMLKNGGNYENDMREAMEYFFSVYPYTVYRDYFDVTMVAAISNEAGMSVKTPGKNVDTVFGTIWDGGNSTGIDCNYDTVVEYVSMATGSSLNDITVIMPINTPAYAGTCMMGPGFSIAMCPAGNWFEELVNHEAGGHGFAKLCDEYVYYNSTIPANVKTSLQTAKSSGLFPNIDFSGNISGTSWSAFAANPSKYPMVGTYQGAYMYGLGIWRPEQNSCMNDNVPYYNAPSRYAMVRRIKKLSGEDSDYTAGEFMAEDVVPAYPSFTRAPGETFIPFAPPIIIE